MEPNNLISERLTFEPLGLNHLSQNYVDWMNDAQVNQYMESGGGYTLKKLKHFLLEQERKKILFWAIIIKDSNKHIGNIKINPIDTNNNSGEYGIMIGDRIESRKGYAREASETIINYCFDELDFSEITLGVNHLNKNAIKLYERLGFIKYDRTKFPEKYANIKDDIIRMSKKKYTDKFILGTAQFGMDYGINNSKGKISQEEIHKILEYSYYKGIRHLDTAELYGNSIDLIAEFHNQHPEKKFKVFSKAIYGKNNYNYSDNIMSNLKKLCLESYEGYMIHNYQFFRNNQKLYSEIKEAKNSGLIKKIGISLYSNDEVKEVLNKNLFDFIQLPFNLLDNSSKRESVIKSAKSSNIEIHVRSIFLQGLFFKSQALIPQKLKPLEKYINQLIAICSDLNIDLDELAVNYTLGKDYIDKIVFGIDNLNQLERNICIIENRLSIPSLKIDKINVLEKELLSPTNW